MTLCGDLVGSLLVLHKGLSEVAASHGWESWKLVLDHQQNVTLEHIHRDGTIVLVNYERCITPQQVKQLLILSDANA